MTMGFISVPNAEVKQALQDPEWAEEMLELEQREEDPSCDLDKAWGGIEFLIEAAGVRFDLFMGGEMIGDDGYTFGWSAEDVARAAQTLRAAPFEQLAPLFDAQQMISKKIYPNIWADDFALGYLRDNYAGLTEFFEATAAKGYGAIMQWG